MTTHPLFIVSKSSEIWNEVTNSPNSLIYLREGFCELVVNDEIPGTNVKGVLLHKITDRCFTNSSDKKVWIKLTSGIEDVKIVVINLPE